MQEGTYGNLTYKDAALTNKDGKVLFKDFGNVQLLDVAARATKNLDEQKFLDGLIRHFPATQYVDSLNSYFNADERFAEFLTTGNGGIVPISDDDRAIVEAYASLRERFDIAYAPPPPPPYPFAEVPEGIDPLKDVKINKTNVRYKNRYSVDNSNLQKWVTGAIKRWRSGATAAIRPWGSEWVSGGGWNTVSIHSDKIVIGCQRIPRYVVEAIAKEKAWLS